MDSIATLRLSKLIYLPALWIFLSAHLFAAEITGSVTNGTSNKPSVGDDVVVLSLAHAMDEVAHTKTDSQGHFSITAPEGQNLLRVDHQGVNYFKPAPQGPGSVDITVYDSARNVDGITADGRVFRFQTISSDQLEVSELFVLTNQSNPPRTKMGTPSFEFGLPAGAQIEEGMAQGPGGMPTTSIPIPVGKKNHYGFVFPIRPGESRFRITYKVPYAGTREFRITPEAPLTELGIMLPQSMQFESKDPSFGRANDESGMTVFVAKSVAAGKELRFSVSGEGTSPKEDEAAAGASPQAQSARRGSPGAPSEPADPLRGSLWYVIAIFVLIVTGLGYWLFRMQGGRAFATADHTSSLWNGQGGSRARQASAVASQAGPDDFSVLNAIKEELFELETELLQGKISPQEYETAKAGLEALMRRQMKRS